MSKYLLLKVSRFTLVGAANALIYAAATQLYADIWNTDAAVAAGLGYATAVPVAFLGHRQLTFKAHGALSPQFVRFVASHFVGFWLAVTITWLASDLMKWPVWVGVVATIFSVSIINYLIMDKWVFASN